MLNFQGAIYNIQQYAHGTQGFLNQIVNTLNLNRSTSASLDPKHFKSLEFFNFAYKTFFNHTFTDIYEDQMLPCYKNKNFDEPFRSIFLNYFNLGSDFREPVLTGTRVLINKVVIHSLEYNKKLNSNSYTVNFSVDQIDEFGEVEFFFEYQNIIYCMINKFKIEPNARHVLPESSGYFYHNTLSMISKFYNFVSKKNMQKKNYVIVQAKDVKYKCFLVSTDKYFFLTKIKYDFEHD